MQRKIFRIEKTLPVRRMSAAPVCAQHRHTVDARNLPQGKSRPVDSTQPLISELALLQEAFGRHKRDLAALIGTANDRRLARACGELGAAVESMEKGAETILMSAESIDDSARALATTLTADYERGLAQDIQDHTVRIFEACNFQDLAGQRIGKVIATLNEVEDLLVQMLARCDGAPVSSIAEAPARGGGLLNGPKLDGDSGHASQRDIDAMFG
ncbi:MAG: protein phosphatase CheZ [Pseudolabrys sp.]|nr:protein phosphatase CheZ [Pseudolabrys sp.]